MQSPRDSWFAALPDCERARPAALVLRPSARCVLNHPSGRPWLLGSWSPHEILHARTRTAAVALLGLAGITGEELSRKLARCGDPSAFDAVPGSFHLIAALDGRLRVRGTASGVRRVWHACVAGVTVAADRGEVLARAIGADIDERVLAARLVAPALPHGLSDLSPWRGVHSVPADRYLLAERDGRGSTVRWWSAPDPVLPLGEGAREVRDALTAAVSVRTRLGGTVSADLSGGMDSTSLCAIAAHGAARVVSVVEEPRDPEHEDILWAARAARQVDTEHRVLAAGSRPMMFAGLAPGAGEWTDPELPFPWIRGRQKLAHLGEVVAGSGARVHLAGHGGDELFSLPVAHLHGLVGDRPLASLRRLRGYRAMGRWPLTSVLAGLRDRSTYRQSLRVGADLLGSPWPRGQRPDFGWSIEGRMPPWATRVAVQAARALYGEVAGEVEELAADRAQHRALHEARLASAAVRQADRLMRRHGVPLEVPLLDDSVVAAALAVRIEDRGAPHQFKPVLAEAMRGIVPGFILDRRSKGEFSAEVYAGFRAHRAGLAELFADSVLARRGLIDDRLVRELLVSVHHAPSSFIQLDPTLACESWLRTLEEP
ncbi:lasso peptide isopeptide bond-forming cyclase [Kutzneria viridogrisea]|uniref:asparagine synthase (glutamine-hydrolyzing) n=1 Tax=Kutzneria viridogrisea TaxID=47990 RepID=A0ABR6BVV0_9PSEU|nr:asparagine synthase (glutamine-hydrolyzing) [Kutzneria viridogrisea]